VFDDAAVRVDKETIMCVPGCREAIQRAMSRRRFFKGAAAAGLAATADFAATAGPAAIAATPASAQRRFTSVIDLTHTLSPEFPTFFGTPGITIERRYTFKKDGANVNWWSVLEHAGTHVDAPFHYSDTGAAAEMIPADQLVVPLAIVDVSAQAARNADYAMTRQDILDWEARHGRLPDNCCVAMNSGWAQHVVNAAKFTGRQANAFHFPGVSPEAADWLISERRVAGLAVDTMSLDPGVSKDFKTHKLWLPSGRWGIENVAGLDKVPATGATLVVGLPKVKGASGGPSRIFALV
jgi:kynurenine formamidase